MLYDGIDFCHSDLIETIENQSLEIECFVINSIVQPSRFEICLTNTEAGLRRVKVGRIRGRENAHDAKLVKLVVDFT